VTTARTIFWTLLILSGVVILYELDNRPVRGHLGSAIACSNRFPFPDSQAEILEYGLQDVRGIAWDGNKNRIFIAEGNRSLLIDWLDFGAGTSGNTAAPTLEETEARTMCPDESCGVAAERGLAILDGKLFSAEHGRGRIAVRDLPPARFKKDKNKDEGAAWLLSASALPGKHELLTEPSGIAAVDRSLFITDEPLRPPPTPEASATKAASKDNSNASAERAADSEKATAQPSGALYVCATDQCSPMPIATGLRHPSGVAAEKAEGPIIVAETDSQEVRWPVYEKLGGKWQETRSLGSVPVSGKVLPAFLGVALDDSRKMVFAAGPGGLYVFDLDGTLLGRIMFDDPVTGVATGGNHVYLAIGDTLCALTFDQSLYANTPAAPPRKPSADVPNSGAGQPGPKSHVPKPSSEASKANNGLGQGTTNSEAPYRPGAQPRMKKPDNRTRQNCDCKGQK
jgi:hypothetical protein